MAKKPLSASLELRKFMRASPFIPFHIKMTDGGTLTITHAEFAISPKGDEAVVYAKGREGHRVLNLRQVIPMEPVRRQPSK